MIKKLLTLLSAFILIFSLVACGPGDGGASNDNDSSTTVESGSEDEASNEISGEAEEVQSEAENLEEQAQGEASGGNTGGGETGGATGGDEETGG